MMGDGACTNSDDFTTLENLGEVGLEEAIGSCITQCLAPDSPGCPTCLSGATGLTDPCVACFVTVTECTIANCVASCIDPSSADCAQCREDNCNAEFAECSGIER